MPMLKRLGLLTATALIAVSMTTAAQAQKQQLKMSTIAPGSSMYLVMTTFANLVNQNVPNLEITVDATGTATKHMVDVAKESIDMSMTAPAVYEWMANGTRMYGKLKGVKDLAKNLNMVFWFPAGGYHYVTYADSGIKTLNDLKGKRVFVGPPSGGQLFTGLGFIQAATGMHPKKGDFKSVNLNFASALQAFQDRQIDAYTIACLDPCAQLQQIAATSKFRFLGLDSEADLMATEPLKKFFSTTGRLPGSLKPDAYGANQVNDKPIWTNDAILGVTVRKTMDTDTVYNMVKAFWSNLDGIRKSAPYMNQVSIQYAARQENMDFHPGAEKYYREVGVWPK